MSCALCGNDRFEAVSSRDAKSGEDLSVSLCATCGLIQQTPIPSIEQLQVYYSHQYRMEYKNTYTPKPSHVYRAARLAIQRIAFLQACGINAGSLLDVGAGGGEFVYAARLVGFDAEGIEPNLGYSEYASAEYDCSVRTAELNDITQRYDVITLFHVLEHLPAPVVAFETMYRALNPGGVLFVEVPAIEAHDTSPHNIFFRAHIFYFTVDTLLACASPYFDAKKVDCTSNLKVILTPKAEPTEAVLPAQDRVDSVREVINSKTWVNYLTRGNGALKPVQKMMRRWSERQANGQSGRQIIDALVKDSGITTD